MLKPLVVMKGRSTKRASDQTAHPTAQSCNHGHGGAGTLWCNVVRRKSMSSHFDHSISTRGQPCRGMEVAFDNAIEKVEFRKYALSELLSCNGVTGMLKRVDE